MIDDDLPDPLIPAEVDLRDFATMPLDVRKLRDSRFAAQVTGEAFRAGVLLWCAAWHQVPTGSLPDDDIELSALAGFGRVVSAWREVKAEALLQFVRCNDGRLYHATVCETAAEAWASRLAHYFDRACDRLRKANKARETAGQPPVAPLAFDEWNRRRIAAQCTPARADASTGTDHDFPRTTAGIPPEKPLKGKGTEQKGKGKGNREGTKSEGVQGAMDLGGTPAPPPPPAPAPTKTPRKSLATPATGPGDRSRRAPTAETWPIPADLRAWAADKHPGVNLRLETEAFRDHEFRDPKTDWSAAWKNWIRKAWNQLPPAQRGTPGKTARQAADDLASRVEARLGFAPDPGPAANDPPDYPIGHQEVIDAAD